MKTLLYTLLFACVLSTSYAQTTARAMETNDDGDPVQPYGELKNGKREGQWRFEFVGTNNLESEGSYKNNTKVGTWTYYYDTPNKVKHVVKQDPDGNLIQVQGFSINGSKSFDLQYQNGKLNGLCKWWYDNGNLRAEEEYSVGVLNGVIKHYYENGQLKVIRRVENGNNQGEFTEYHENGKISVKGHFKDNLRTGEWKQYYPSGKLQLLSRYYKGNKFGGWSEYHENGQLAAKYFFTESGVREGEYSIYFENGVLRKQGVVRQGEEKEYKVYGESGSLVEEGKTEGDKNIIKVYYENGRLFSYRLYESGGLVEMSIKDSLGNDLPIGTFKNGNGILFNYDQDGNVTGKYEFKNGVAIREVKD